jgi:hypothetical protein
MINVEFVISDKSDAAGHKMISNHIGEQQQEIESLKSRLTIADALINKRVDENELLKVQVERYQKLVCQTCDGHGAVGNILDSMDCPDCTAISAISYVEQLQSSIKAQHQEINELRAMVNALNESLSKNQDWVRCGIGGNCGGYPQDHKDYIAITDLLKKTPRQCLIDSNIKAINEFNKFCQKNMGMSCSSDGYFDKLREAKS